MNIGYLTDGSNAKHNVINKYECKYRKVFPSNKLLQVTGGNEIISRHWRDVRLVIITLLPQLLKPDAGYGRLNAASPIYTANKSQWFPANSRILCTVTQDTDRFANFARKLL